MAQDDPARNPALDEDPDDESLVTFRYYMFDWDDNILHMPTKIYLERRTEDGTWEPYPVSTAHFATIRRDTEHYRPLDGDWDHAFVEFYDVGKRGERAFLEDCEKALAPVIRGETNGGPSFNRFRKALLEGRLFAIITARAHASSSIRKAVEYFIDKILSKDEKALMVANLRRYNQFFNEADPISDDEVVEKYLGLNKYRGVTSPEFQQLIGREIDSGAQSPTRAKQYAIREFVQHVVDLVGRIPGGGTHQCRFFR